MDAFLHIRFTHHRVILGKIKSLEERLFYIRRCANEHFTVDALKNSLAADDYHHQGSLPNNFVYINVEEINARERADVDEKVLENAIIY